MADATTTQEAPLSHANALDDLVTVADVVSSLKSRGILALGADGHFSFVNPSSQQIVEEAADIEALVKLHGVSVPPNLDKILGCLGLILPMIGVK